MFIEFRAENINNILGTHDFRPYSWRIVSAYVTAHMLACRKDSAHDFGNILCL